MSMSGMTDMSGMTEMGGETMGGMMKPWLHFSMGDNIFFMAWVPLSAGAVVGACIGLVMLAIVERWLAAMRAVMEKHWAQKTDDLLAARFTNLPDDSSACTEKKDSTEGSQETEMERSAGQRARSGQVVRLGRSAPFIAAHDITRGAMHACQAALGYTLMLAVMTFHAGYIISIVVGLGIGEVIFGRFGRGASVHH